MGSFFSLSRPQQSAPYAVESSPTGPLVTLAAADLTFLDDIDPVPQRVAIPYLDQTGFLLSQLLSDHECQRLIEYFENNNGFTTLNSLDGYPKRYRDCERIQLASTDLADRLWRRACTFFGEMNIVGDPRHQCLNGPPYILRGQWKPVGLNPRFRLCKYSVGGHFSPHFDGVYVESDERRSHQTFMVYLNDDFEGGNTNFIRSEAEDVVGDDGKRRAAATDVELRLRPEKGAAVVFNHHRLHEGEALRTGFKYIFRTDVVYQRVEHQAPSQDEGLQAGLAISCREGRDPPDLAAQSTPVAASVGQD